MPNILNLGNATITSVHNLNEPQKSAANSMHTQNTQTAEHPVEAVRKLSKDLKVAFPIPYDGNGTISVKKRRLS